MADQVIECFKQEFDRFHTFLEQQIDACPDAAWTEKVGRFTYWQHLMHVLACAEFFVRLPGAAPIQTVYSPDEVRFKVEPHRVMDKADMRALAAEIKKAAYAFLATQSAATLALKHETMSQWFGRDCLNIQALVGLVRHHCYHIGCCDQVLRAHGLVGVY